ncbi:hypothetical protein [Salinibius halmophilus]|uniref:hypothetical protein n=1 Tax=Salinibius halmophilus TaxID=1853216 RepID=UPI000E66C3EE|nr:hypothetical protein [Salinibius halmophilus]
MRLLTALLLVGISFFASADAELVLDSYAFIEVPKAGEVVKQPVEFVDPGDIILMELHINNIGTSAATNFEVDNPIPELTKLYELPEARFNPFVGNANGQFFPVSQLQGQRLDQITQLRWTIPLLDAGDQIVLRFRVIVNAPD